MDTEYETEPGGARSRLHPALAAAMEAERSRLPEAAEAERSMLATHRDPTLAGHDPDSPEADMPVTAAGPEVRARAQVRWVRPTDLAMQGGARATGWGLDLRVELEQRLAEARTALGQKIAKARAQRQAHPVDVGDGRAQRLPDLSISGRRRTSRRDPERSGMGLR